MFRSLLARAGQLALAAFFVLSGIYTGEPSLGLFLAMMFLSSAGLDLQGVSLWSARVAQRVSSLARAAGSSDVLRRSWAALPWLLAALGLTLAALRVSSELVGAAISFYVAAWLVLTAGTRVARTLDAPRF